MSDWLKADDLIRVIDTMVLDPKHPAFAHNGHTHLYSGPLKSIRDAILGIVVDNHGRALMRRRQLGAVIIDDTLVGKYLINFKGIRGATISGKGTFDYFRVNPDIDDSERVTQALAPWQQASRYFAMASWGYVSTTVCGASTSGVYYTLEVPYAINPDHKCAFMPPIEDTIRNLFIPRKKPIEFVNLIPFARVEKAYSPSDWLRAQKIICLGEQRMALHDALAGVNPKTIREGIKVAAHEVLSRPIETYQYYLESGECYKNDRQLMFASTHAKPKKSHTSSPLANQKARQHKIEEFGLMALQLVKTEIDLMPPASRPSIPAFSLVDGKVTLAV